MHHDLKHRIQAMRDKLEGRALSLKFRVARSFLSPSPECRRLVELADVRETDRILEPSAGTGAILQAIRDAVPGRSVTPWSCTPG
jgi:tRNA G10  N-methylase Trm11